MFSHYPCHFILSKFQETRSQFQPKMTEHHFPLSFMEMSFLVVELTNQIFLYIYEYHSWIFLLFGAWNAPPLNAENFLYSSLNNRIYHSTFNISLTSLINASSIWSQGKSMAQIMFLILLFIYLLPEYIPYSKHCYRQRYFLTFLFSSESSFSTHASQSLIHL